MNQIKFEIVFANSPKIRVKESMLVRGKMISTILSQGKEEGEWIKYARQFTGLYDKNGNEIYAEDLLEDGNGKTFRVYAFTGGFVIKASYWSESLEDLTQTDPLILQPLSDIQTIEWIKDHCEIIGNAYQAKDI